METEERVGVDGENLSVSQLQQQTFAAEALGEASVRLIGTEEGARDVERRLGEGNQVSDAVLGAVFDALRRGDAEAEFGEAGGMLGIGDVAGDGVYLFLAGLLDEVLHPAVHVRLDLVSHRTGEVAGHPADVAGHLGHPPYPPAEQAASTAGSASHCSAEYAPAPPLDARPPEAT